MEPSQASEDPSRVRVAESLEQLAVTSQELPATVLARLNHRSRNPDARLLIGRYLIVGELGRGGMGVVYDAWDPGIERRVAIKTIEPQVVADEERQEVIARFRRETKIVGQLNHPAIVTIFDFGQERSLDPVTNVAVPSLVYYVMEYLEGQSLAKVLQEGRVLSDIEAVTIAADIADALQLSHEAGIIHRDIKPSNIFLRNGSDAVLLDFGIAKQGSVALTRQGQILGTPSYLAPERLREKHQPIDGRADIFSLGVLLFTMLTGEAPFVGHDIYEVIDKIAKQARPDIQRAGQVGMQLSQVLDRMLAKRREDRFATAGAAAAALRSLLSAMRSEALRPGSLDDKEATLDSEVDAQKPAETQPDVEVAQPAPELPSFTAPRSMPPSLPKSGSAKSGPPPLPPRTNPSAVADDSPTPDINGAAEDLALTKPEVARHRSAHDATAGHRHVNGAFVTGAPGEGQGADAQAEPPRREVVRVRGARPRIQAELVDESQVVVRPTELDPHEPDNAPTQSTFEPYKDPAETEQGVPVKIDNARVRRLVERARSDIRGRGEGEAPLDRPLSAAVARRTIAAAPGRATATADAVQVRMSGPGLHDDKSLIKRRLMVLLAGGLASAAIGLMLGRMRQSISPPVYETSVEAGPQARQRSTPPQDDRSAEPELVRPRTPRELLLDADSSRTSGAYADAIRLYTRALAALPSGHALRAPAQLGRAEALRGLGRVPDAVTQYRAVVRAYPNTIEAYKAKTALQSIQASRPPPPPPPPPRRAIAKAKPEPTSPPRPLPAPSRSPSGLLPSEMSAEQACRWVSSRFLMDPRGAVNALETLRRQHPAEPCVFWNLGRKYETIKQHRAALAAYRRFLTLRPDSPRAPAVQRRINNLEGKLGMRSTP